MNKIKLARTLSSVPAFGLTFLMLSSVAAAATSPSLGRADTFSILSSTYTNTVPGTTINGDVGYTVGPAVAATVNGTTHVANGTYNQAGIDQAAALSTLNSQPCTFNFPPGIIDLATDTTHGTLGSYAPGVYCTTGAASIGTAGITLSGTGTYIFRVTGALTSAANSSVTLANGASACNVWWTPTAATTLGANSSFAGTDISAAGITIGNLTTWTGRALAFGGTVTTSRNTINTIPACAAASNTSSGNPTVPGTGTGSGTGTMTGTDGLVPGLPNTGHGAPAATPSLLWLTLPAVLTASVFYVIRKKTVNAV